MTTANARTDAIGRSVAGLGAGLGDLCCKTDQFKIDKADGKGGVFMDASIFSVKDNVALGDVLNHSVDVIQIIGQNLFENGAPLTRQIGIFVYMAGKRYYWEIRTKGKRYICINKRVYSKKIK